MGARQLALIPTAPHCSGGGLCYEASEALTAATIASECRAFMSQEAGASCSSHWVGQPNFQHGECFIVPSCASCSFEMLQKKHSHSSGFTLCNPPASAQADGKLFCNEANARAVTFYDVTLLTCHHLGSLFISWHIKAAKTHLEKGYCIKLNHHCKIANWPSIKAGCVSAEGICPY